MNEKAASPTDLEASIKKLNLLEKEELEALGQRVDQEGNLTFIEGKNKKTRRFRLLIALAFVGASIFSYYGTQGSNEGVASRDTTVSENSDAGGTNPELQIQEITTFEQRLADFSRQYNFEIVPTDQDSADHNERLGDDTYAINFLLKNVALDMERQQQESQIAEVITQMYFRRDAQGNPIVGVFFDPEIISRRIAESDDSVVSLNHPIGWVEYSAISSERRFPELFSYQVNGQEVFAQSNNLRVETGSDGSEVLIEDTYENVDIAEMNNDDRAEFLIEEVGVWSDEEYQFLLDSGYIAAEDGFWDDIDEVYYNDSPQFKYGLGQPRDLEPIRSGFQTVFSIPSTRIAQTYTTQEADTIRSEGLVISFDEPRYRKVEAFNQDATFYPEAATFTAQNNQQLLTDLAQSHPDTTLVVAMGEEDAYLDQEALSDNIIAIGLYMRGMSPQGADFLVYPDDNGTIFDSVSAANRITRLLLQEEPENNETYLSELSHEDSVWRGSDQEAFEESIRVLRFE